MKSFLILITFFFAMPTNAEEINGRAFNSNVDFREKTVKQLVAIHDKQVKQLETCKTRDCFQSIINDHDALFNALRVKLILEFLRKTNQLASKNCTDCKTAIATKEVK